MFECSDYEYGCWGIVRVDNKYKVCINVIWDILCFVLYLGLM